MAQRKLKIALSSSLDLMSASASIFLDDVPLEENIVVNQVEINPQVFEFTFEAVATHTLKINFNNDYFADGSTDLNLIVNYVALSNADLSYTENSYLIQDYFIWGPSENLVLEFIIT
jgi:L-rhamnose isomerase